MGVKEGTDLAAKCANAYLPFGVGSRMCVGHNFALREAKISLVRIFQQFTFALEPDQVPLLLSHGTTLSPKLGVFAKVALRSDVCRAEQAREDGSSP
ncbi:MAG: hypothetical protein WDW36_006399 [Sanguina aurantia]